MDEITSTLPDVAQRVRRLVAAAIRAQEACSAGDLDDAADCAYAIEHDGVRLAEQLERAAA